MYKTVSDVRQGGYGYRNLNLFINSKLMLMFHTTTSKKQESDPPSILEGAIRAMDCTYFPDKLFYPDSNNVEYLLIKKQFKIIINTIIMFSLWGPVIMTNFLP